MSKKISIVMVLVLCVSVMLAGCGGGKEPAPADKSGAKKEYNLNIAGKPSPSATYTVAASVAKMLNEKTKHLHGFVVTYPSDVVFPDKYADKTIQLSINVLNTGAQSCLGMGAWEGRGSADNRLISTGNKGQFSVVIARPDAGIKTMYDLKGKKVMGLIRGSVLSKDVWSAMEYGYGLNSGNFQLMEYTNVTEMTTALKEKRVDAINYPFFGTNASWVEELISMGDGVFVPHDPAVLEKILAKFTHYNKLTIPAGTYRDQKEDIVNYGSYFTLDVAAFLPDDVVYDITSTLYNNFNEWASFHDSIKAHALPESIEPSRLSYVVHPGAVKYYKEKGLWTEEHEKMQQKNIKIVEGLGPYKKASGK